MSARRASSSRSPGKRPLAGTFHEPALVEDVILYLSPGGHGLYLDGTVGGGGHALRVLEVCQSCRLLAVDRDPEALAVAARTLAPHAGRVRFLHATFDQVPSDEEVREHGLAGALLDLGVSSWQIDRPDRGFSFARSVPLDMRMGGDDAEAVSASRFLSEAPESRLTEVFREYGEEPRARRLARELVRRRVSRPLLVSDDLVAALAATLRRAPSNREKARVFQAVRIEVNEELVVLERALPGLRDALHAGAVLVVIAYHSLEDRIVKEAFREWSLACVCPPELPVCVCRGHSLGETLTKRPVRPAEEEVERNPRSRSARLRAWRKAA